MVESWFTTCHPYLAAVLRARTHCGRRGRLHCLMSVVTVTSPFHLLSPFSVPSISVRLGLQWTRRMRNHERYLQGKSRETNTETCYNYTSKNSVSLCFGFFFSESHTAGGPVEVRSWRTHGKLTPPFSISSSLSTFYQRGPVISPGHSPNSLAPLYLLANVAL